MNGSSSRSAGDSHNRQIRFQQQQTPQYAQPNLKHTKIKGKKSRDSSCCSINFIKYVLQTFNVILFVSKCQKSGFVLIQFTSSR